MKNTLIFISSGILLLLIYFNLERSSNNYVIKNSHGELINADFIDSKGLLRLIVNDTKYIPNGANGRVLTIYKDIIGVNDKYPIVLFKKYFYFTSSSKKFSIIKNIKSANDTIYFNGFKYYDFNFGSENDVFIIYKIDK